MKYRDLSDLPGCNLLFFAYPLGSDCTENNFTKNGFWLQRTISCRTCHTDAINYGTICRPQPRQCCSLSFPPLFASYAPQMRSHSEHLCVPAAFSTRGPNTTSALASFLPTFDISTACSTPSEYRLLLGTHSSSTPAPSVHSTIAAPDAVDWRSFGAVTPVKDQNQCSSDWAFGAVAAQETRWHISGRPLIAASEQNLVDCITKGCYGCSASDYPYKRYQISQQRLPQDR
jgi:C1A family cysteine protease